jgi:hypothetical protein
MRQSLSNLLSFAFEIRRPCFDVAEGRRFSKLCLNLLRPYVQQSAKLKFAYFRIKPSSVQLKANERIRCAGSEPLQSQRLISGFIFVAENRLQLLEE